MENSLTIAKQIGNFVSNILLGETKEIIIRTEQRVAGIEATISEMKSDIKDVRATLRSHEAGIAGLKVHTGYGFSSSPVTPSGKGEKLLRESGFYEIYPSLKTKLFDLMKARNLRTLYDYEKGAERALGELQNDPQMDPLKEHAVNHPEEPLELIFRVASWVIRDDFAKEQKGH